jgi:polar amino acid transport system permease protein
MSGSTAEGGWTVDTVWSWESAREVAPLLLEGLRNTVIATAGGSAVALVLGLLLAMMGSSGNTLVRVVSRCIVGFFRGSPLLILLYFGYFALPSLGITWSAMTVGIVVLGLYDGVYMSESYRAAIQAIPSSQVEAAHSLSMSRVRIWTKVLIPQALPHAIPPLGNYIIMMFKQSALLATIAVPELLHAAQSYGQRTYRYTEAMTLAAVFFLIVSLSASVVLRISERKLRSVNSL